MRTIPRVSFRLPIHRFAQGVTARLLLLLQPLLISAPLPCPAWGQDAPAPVRLEESYGDAFVHYQAHRRPPQEKPQQQLPATPTVPAQPQAQVPTKKPKEPSKELVDVAWLRKNYPILEERAINDPTEVNVSAYLYAKRIILDKSARFSEMVYRVTQQDPLLNENNRIPYASVGAQSVQNADRNAQEQAVRELTRVGGAVLFIDSTCRFCALQLSTMTALKKTLGLQFIVISIDGNRPKNYQGDVLADNGLYKKLGLKLTPSVVFVPTPKAYEGRDPNQYLVISQGFYAQDEMAKQLAFAGRSTSLLSKETMNDLAVWQYGVASSEDLTSLKLDLNHPEDFKQTLGPILLKQYR